jgi:hypothetical protein
VTDEFTADSANKLLRELPEDHELVYYDPDEAKNYESWIFIRRAGQRYFMSQIPGNSKYRQISFEAALASFMSCPLVRKVLPEIPSFTISRIPEHERLVWSRAVSRP